MLVGIFGILSLCFDLLVSIYAGIPLKLADKGLAVTFWVSNYWLSLTDVSFWVFFLYLTTFIDAKAT